MSTRSTGSAAAAGLVIGASIALGAGCGDDEDERPAVEALPPPTVRITALRTSSGKSFEVASGDPAAVEAGCDPQLTLALELSIEPPESFRLRPPGACVGIAQCGTVLVTVNAPGGKTRTLRSVSLSTPIRLSELPFEPGEHVFSVELRDGADEPVAIPQSVTSDSLAVNVLPPGSCSPSDGGSDAGDAGDADDGGESDAPDAGDAGDAEPDTGNDAPADAVSDALDAAADQTPSDGPADVEADQG